MNFEVTIPERVSFTVQCTNEQQIYLVEHNRINLIVSIVKDGKDGRDGVDGRDGIDGAKGEKGDPGDVTLVTRTLEQVREENPIIEGDIDANGNSIKNLRNAVASQEPATKGQLDALLLEAKSYADTVSADTVRWAGFHDASAGTYPAISGIRRGDEFEVSVAGTINGEFYEIGDLLRARINSPGQIPNNWSSSQGNVQQATETRQGTARIINATDAANENSLNDTDIVTSKKLWQNFWQRILALSWTWNSKQIFATAPRLSSTTAGQYLKVDSNKDVTSVSSIPAGDVTETSTKRFVTDSEKNSWNNKVEATTLNSYEKFYFVDVTDNVVGGATGEQAHKYYLIPANTFRIGSKIQIDFEIVKSGAFTNGEIFRLRHHTSPVATGGTQINFLNASAATREIRSKSELVIRAGNVAHVLLQDTSIAGIGSSTSAPTTFTFDPTVDNYFFATTGPNTLVEYFTQIYFNIKAIY